MMLVNSVGLQVQAFLLVAAVALPVFGAKLFGHSGVINPGMPTIRHLDVKCGRSGMTVYVTFDQPFPGVIYSKGHYDEKNCNYITEKTSGKSNYTFLIPIDGCGTQGQLEDARPGRDMYFENTIIVQMDPLITEVWDSAKLLKCVWPHTMLRRVKASPFQVYEPQRVAVKLDKRSINTLMEIQQGPGPFDAPATGYVYMGDDTSVVIYVQDPKKSVDANVVNCSATTASGERVQLLDDAGCLLRPDLMTNFDKSRKSNGVKADLMLYSYLKAFRVGESPEFTFRCQLEVCRGRCRQPCSSGLAPARKKRAAILEFPQTNVDDSLDEVNVGYQRQKYTDAPAARVDLEQAVLVVEREQLGAESSTQCVLPRSVLAAMLALLGVVAALSLLSCILAIRLARVTTKHSTP